MNNLLYKKRSILVFILPTVLVYVCIVVLPIFASFYIGLFKWDGIGKMQFVALNNFIRLFGGDLVFRKAITNSFILAGASTLIQLPVAFLLALVLANGVRFEKFFRTVYFVPVILSSMVIGQLWLKIFNADYGLFNSLLKMIGLGNLTHPWLADPTTAFLCTVVPAVWQYAGQYILIFYAGMKGIQGDIYEAARIDGANGWQSMTRITMPLMLPVIKVCLILSLTGSFKSFDLVYVMTNGGPLHSSDLPSTAMYSNLFGAHLYGYGSAQAVFIVLECLAATLILQMLFKKPERDLMGN